jgi:hypothetical protein
MKTKIILFLIAMISTAALKAQTQKGDQLIGGNIGFSGGNGTGDYPENTYQTNYTNKSFSVSIGPGYSYFISDKLDLGVSLGYNDQKTRYNYLSVPVQPVVENTVVKFHSFNGSIYLRKYFFFNDKIGIRTGPFVSFQKGRSDNYYTNPVQNYFSDDYSYNAGINADLVFFPSKKLGFAANLGSLAYSHDDDKQSNFHTRTNNFGFNVVGSGLSLSAFYCIGK